MRKLSKLNENVFDDMLKRSSGRDERTEDKVSNINDLKPVDMGKTVYWADRDLTIYGETLIEYEDKNLDDILASSEWRLPTLLEVADLDDADLLYDKSNFYIKYCGETLTFPKTGVGYRGRPGRPNFTMDEGKLYYGWTFNSLTRENIHVFTIENYKFTHSILTSDRWLDQITQNISNRCSVRLVKDK